jgi:hypothetical protein
MKRVVSFLSGLFAVFVVISVSLMQSGCEDAEGLEGLTIDPANITLSTNGQTVVLTVVGGITNRDLALPLEWSVSDGNLGRIVSSSGYSATYQRLSGGGAVNTVTAKDQYENEGYATIRHDAASYSLELSASQSSITVGQASTITITTANSLAPYAWRKRSGPGSLTGASGSKSAVYTSSVAGTAVIEVTDANGASGVIGITVEDKTDDGEGGDGGS